METLNRLPFAAQSAVFQKLASITDVASLSKADRMKDDESLRKFRDTLVVMQTERMEGYAQGWAEGREEGRAVGREEGRKEGREEGRTEAVLSHARLMKGKGYPATDIAEITGLTLEQIAQL